MANDITIRIGAENRAKKVLDAAKRDVNSLASRVKQATVSFRGMFNTIIAAGGAVGVLRSITTEMERIDNIAKTSRKLGLATDELITLRLAAAEFSGMAEGQLDVAIQRMTRRLSEAADKTKATALTLDGSIVQLSGVRKAIADIGLSAVDLNKAGPAQAFRQIADAIQAVENPADQLRIAFQLFDSEGASLVNTLREGSQAIDEMNELAKELDLTFSDFEASRIEAANDAIFELEKRFQSLKRTLAIELGPTLGDTADGIRELIELVKAPAAKLQLLYKGMQVSEMDLIDRILGGTGIVPVIGANGREAQINNVIDEASGRNAGKREAALKDHALRVKQQREQRASEFDAIINGAIDEYRKTGETLQNARIKLLEDHGLMLDDMRVRAFEKSQRFYDITGPGFSQDGDNFAQQSRLLAGGGEKKRNAVVEQVSRLIETTKAGDAKIAKALQEGLSAVAESMPEFREASVEVITA